MMIVGLHLHLVFLASFLWRQLHGMLMYQGKWPVKWQSGHTHIRLRRGYKSYESDVTSWPSPWMPRNHDFDVISVDAQMTMNV